jgi:hypothetical protein
MILGVYYHVPAFDIKPPVPCLRGLIQALPGGLIHYQKEY